MSIRMSTIKLNTDCICLGNLASNARSLQENSQSERACYCRHIIKRYNEGLRDWENVIAITRFCYIEVLFKIFCYYWGKENRQLHRGLRYAEICFIEVPRYQLLLLACSAGRKKIDMVSLRESPYVDIQILNCLFFRQSVMLVQFTSS